MGNESKQAEFAEQFERCLDQVYDLYFQIFGEETKAIELAHQFTRGVVSAHPNAGYDKYTRLWMFRNAVELVQKEYDSFIHSLERDELAPFSYLLLEEKLALFLRDRLELSLAEIAQVMQVNSGRVGFCLVNAREMVAKELLELDWQTNSPVPARVKENLNLEQSSDYGRVVTAAAHYIHSLPHKKFGAIEHAIRVVKVEPSMRILTRRWSELSWQMKFLVEGFALVTVVLVAVVVFPWVNARFNYAAVLDGRFADAFSKPYTSSIIESVNEEEVSADRLLASTNNLDTALVEPEFAEDFSNEEFPVGEGAEMGHAPVAPSRQNAAIYRMILQSPKPNEVAEGIRDIFSSEQVRERSSSGKSVPGGVYFDGITTEASVEKIRDAANKLGVTQTYATHENRRKPDEKARVIVWVQEI